uniref:Uncharacterized protein n=1 Tax=Plectus sambesii TaxID=2011161 RepID=A0A914UPX2_9BILA
MRSINPSISIQQAVGSAAVATAVGFALYHPQSPFAQKRRELGRKEETSTEIGCHVLSTAAIGYTIINHATAGLFPLTAPRDPIHIGLGLAALTTILDLPNVLAENRNIQLFTLNRVHDVVVITTIAGIIKQFLV